MSDFTDEEDGEDVSAQIPTRKRRKEDDLFLALQEDFFAALITLSRSFVAGEITQSQFVQQAMTEIQTAHQQAGQMGTGLAGPSAIYPYEIAARASASQRSFLENFAADLAAGRYAPKSQDGEGAAARNRRFNLYALRLTGTANAAWMAVQKSRGLMVRRVLGSNENHCPSCPRLAAMGWVRASDLMQFPGDGSTECLSACTCVLEASDGGWSFSNSPAAGP